MGGLGCNVEGRAGARRGGAEGRRGGALQGEDNEEDK